MLEECGHIVRVKAMDHLMSSSNEQEIKLPECPWCKTPIRFNPRYSNRIKAIRRDVEQVKRNILGRGVSFDEQFEKLNKRVAFAELCDSNAYAYPISLASPTSSTNDGGKRMNLQTVINNSYVRMCRNIDNTIDENRALLTLRDLSKIEMQFDMFKKLQDLYKIRMSKLDDVQPNHVETDEQLKRFEEDYLFLLKKTKSFEFVTEQEIEDWQNEYNRCRHTITYIRVLKVFKQPDVKLEELKKEKEMLEEVEKLLSDGAKFSVEKESKVGGILKDLKSINPLLVSIGITEEERDMVVKAMGFNRGHWFKCPNGHVYAIGECGGAMEKSQCPQCKALIGGMKHKLEEGNAVASEMDGALHPAYSEEANNMMNFEGLV